MMNKDEALGKLSRHLGVEVSRVYVGCDGKKQGYWLAPTDSRREVFITKAEILRPRAVRAAILHDLYVLMPEPLFEETWESFLRTFTVALRACD